MVTASGVAWKMAVAMVSGDSAMAVTNPKVPTISPALRPTTAGLRAARSHRLRPRRQAREDRRAGQAEDDEDLAQRQRPGRELDEQVLDGEGGHAEDHEEDAALVGRHRRGLRPIGTP